MAREEWGTRAGFILAAVGSAIGLGNIWRFPHIAFTNGGGAFFVPYLFALVTAGIPVLVLEYTLGHRFRGSAPLSLRRLSPRTEWIGWWQVAISFVISTYYAVIIAWAAAYTWFAVDRAWGGNPEEFLFGSFLQAAEAPGAPGMPVAGVLVPLLFIWSVALFVSLRGIRRGIEWANRIFIPLLVAIFLVLVVRAVTLPGAVEGLNALFQPDWEAMGSGSVWVAAYSQIFFSLSIAFAIMITYSSYLPRNSDLTNNAFIAGFSNSSFELLAGIGVFAALGFMSQASGTPVQEVVESGIGLAFVVFPQIINELPGLNSLFGFLFFGALVLAGMSSLISITETYVAGLQDKFEMPRRRAVAIGVGAAALASTAFATRGGVYLLDATDYFINNFGVALVGLTEVVMVAWILRALPALQNHANYSSDILLGTWWRVALTVITPIVLGYMLIDSLRTALESNYEGYPTEFLLATGWAAAIGVLLVGILMSLVRWQQDPRLREAG